MNSNDYTNSQSSNTVMTNGLSMTRLADKIARFTDGKNQVDTDIEGLTLHYWPHKTEPTSYMLAPSLCLIGQGQKRLFLGENTFIYDPSQFLITSVDLPVISQIIEATDEDPYLGLTLELDFKVIARMILDCDQPYDAKADTRGAVSVSHLDAPVLSAMERLLELLETPSDIPVLAPLIKQEIFYRLLVGQQGPRLRRLVSADSHNYRIARAVDWITGNFDKPLRVDDLAEQAGLSNSAFHSHFRNMTAMSPLQFQKKIRLNEARRLMLTERMDASTAAFEVGYESPTQFSREYSRHFGAPPMRDIKSVMENTLV